MPSVVERRVAARIEQRQIEALLAVEGIAERIDRLAARAEREAVAAIQSGDAAAASSKLSAMIPAIKDHLESQFRRLANWSHQRITDILAEEIPRRWLRLAAPVVLFAGEAAGIIADTPTEPIANSGKRMSDKRWAEFLRRFVFKPPSRARVDAIIHRTVAGQVWTERLDALSHLIDDFEQLAKTLVVAYNQGATREEIVTRVKPRVGNITSSAKRIARTEGLRVANAVQREQYDSLGDLVVGIQIIATLDQNTRPHHAARHGRIHWKDPRRIPSLDTLPELPDEPNCRCYDIPVFREPEEFRGNPALLADFRNAGGAAIPDPQVYTQWFAKVDRGRRMMAVGVRRYQEVERLLAGRREPQWTDFIDEEGRLLSISELQSEAPDQKAERLRRVDAAIRQRAELLAKVGTFGFVPED